MQRNPLDQAGGLAAHSSSVFTCILRRQVGLRIQPPCQKLSWTGHWGLRLQSSHIVNWVAVTCLSQLDTVSLMPLVVGTARGEVEHCLLLPSVGCLIICMLLQARVHYPNRSHLSRVCFIRIAFRPNYYKNHKKLMCFPKKNKTRNLRKFVFRGSHGVTSDGAQELENDNLHHVSTDWMPALVIFRPNGWVEPQSNCTRTSSGKF